MIVGGDDWKWKWSGAKWAGNVGWWGVGGVVRLETSTTRYPTDKSRLPTRAHNGPE